MLTADDVGKIPLFSSVSAADLELVVPTSADIHLSADEFAVTEDGERALYAVLAGTIEVGKLIDCVERTLGWRVPGTIFGEVPLALGAPFPGGYRAVRASRVMRVDTAEYYTLAASNPEVATRKGALARERLGVGLTRLPIAILDTGPLWCAAMLSQ